MTTPRDMSDDFLTRRESDAALDAAIREQDRHNEAHDKAHEAHAKEHAQEARAVETALAAVDRERNIHAEAHDREHTAHHREHVLVNLAVDKAEAATDKRFDTVNGTRDQMTVLVQTLASRDSLDAYVKDSDRRFEDMRTQITELQKYDVRGEGRTRGQGMVIAAIIGSVSFAFTVLSLVIVVANLVTK